VSPTFNGFGGKNCQNWRNGEQIWRFLAEISEFGRRIGRKGACKGSGEIHETVALLAGFGYMPAPRRLADEKLSRRSFLAGVLCLVCAATQIR
jgi:hypothetical protein